MKLEDLLLKSQVGQTTKRQITVKTDSGEETADVYVKVLTCGEVEGFPEKNSARHQVAATILDKENNCIFTVEDLVEIPYYLWVQLINISNEVNITGKINP